MYIGCHKTQDKDDGYMGSGKVLRLAQNKYGVENFRKDILFEASSAEEMFDKEKELVFLGSNSYNIKGGGQGGWDFINKNRLNVGYYIPFKKGNVFSSIGGKLGGMRSLEMKVGIYNPDQPNGMSGKHHTDESKSKIGAANKKHQSGSGNSNYGNRWICNPLSRKSISIPKDVEIPEGWIKGRIT